MEREEVIKLIEQEVEKRLEKRLTDEKKKLERLVNYKLSGTGQYAQASYIMDIFTGWLRNR